MYFELLPGAGKHSETGGVMITKPGIPFESNRNLAAMFPNKFKQVAGPTVGGLPLATPEVQAAAAAGAAGIAPAPQPATAPAAAVAAPAALPPAQPAGLGTDVTDLFEEVADRPLMVFSANKKFNVTAKDAPTQPINPKPMGKAETKTFLAGLKGPEADNAAAE